MMFSNKFSEKYFALLEIVKEDLYCQSKIDKTTIISTTNEKLRVAMYKVFGGRCFYSGQLLDSFHIDHIIPMRSRLSDESSWI